MDAFEVDFTVKLKVDAQDLKEAKSYGKDFINAALYAACSEGVSLDYPEDTGIAYEGLNPAIEVIS